MVLFPCRWTAANRGCLCPSTAGSLNWRQGHLCPLLRSKRAAATIPPLTNSRLSLGEHHLRATSPTQCETVVVVANVAGAMHRRHLDGDALMHLRPTAMVSLQSSL